MARLQALGGAALALLLPVARADAPWIDLWKSYGPGGGSEKNISSMWGPSLVVTKVRERGSVATPLEI